MRYRKKPVVIEAVQWDGKLEDIQKVFGNPPLPIGLYPLPAITIETLEGNMLCEIGDWIIKGIKGEFYPVKEDIFEAIYEPVAEA